MNFIKGLIIKDFQTIKSYKSTILFMIVIFVGSAFLNNDVIIFVPIFVPLCLGMCGISSFSYDNLAKSDKYILTFPINKKDIVKARYIYILLFTIGGALLGFLLTILVQSIKNRNIANMEMIENSIATVIGSLYGIMLLQIFQIPIMYKFGAEKGRIIQMIMIIALMLGISLITTMSMTFLNISLDSFLIILKDYLIAILGIFIIILYIFSYVISCKIYARKEI